MLKAIRIHIKIIMSKNTVLSILFIYLFIIKFNKINYIDNNKCH
jgi:hypothetical protein